MITADGFRKLCLSVWSTIAALAWRETFVRISPKEKLPLHQLSPYTNLLFIFVYPSLNNVSSQRRMLGWLSNNELVKNWKGNGRGLSWGIIPAFAWSGLGKSRKAGVRTCGVLTEVRASRLPSVTAWAELLGDVRIEEPYVLWCREFVCYTWEGDPLKLCQFVLVPAALDPMGN
jgi:hypothetical protein